MTGVGKGVSEGERWKVTTFVKSVNGRGLEVSVRSDIFLGDLEQDVRRWVKEYVIRGTVNVVLQIETKLPQSPFDLQKLESILQSLKDVKEKLSLNVSDDTLFMISVRLAGETKEEPDEELRSVLTESLQMALRELVKSREEEGRYLKEDILRRVKLISSLLEEIGEKKDAILQALKEKVAERAREVGLLQEDPTVMNELLFLISRMDVSEEYTRLKAHLQRFLDTLEAEGDIGKKLDFLLQEMHREITTLGNKMPELSHLVVDLKTEIERLRQQVANVE
ncbi:YicC/YloC family endoribonuclease [Thermocrinis albus]|nr:YicC/YloC family endoribonuclease [Thermocrinis albus]